MKLLAQCLACLTGAMLGAVGYVNGPGDVVTAKVTGNPTQDVRLHLQITWTGFAYIVSTLSRTWWIICIGIILLVPLTMSAYKVIISFLLVCSSNFSVYAHGDRLFKVMVEWFGNLSYVWKQKHRPVLLAFWWGCYWKSVKLDGLAI